MVAFPFQKLCCVQPVGEEEPFLLAASGPFISSLNLKNGSLMHQWPVSKQSSQEQNSTQPHGDEGRPTKRQKLEDNDTRELSREESDDSIEIISERKKGERRKPKVESSTLPNVSQIVVTRTAKTAICVTGEDKSVVVFDIQSRGVLSQRSKRTMPKRICAIVLTPDEKNILVGDKFGDVYLLPLHPTEGWAPSASTENAQSKDFLPSATELTVHTKGNLEALKQQRLQKVAQAKKESPQFEHKLLLGHVSLLTDVAIIEIPVETRARQYILTADRDEHIRVSRGITQAHIIEGYCLGHRDFISKLCVLPWQPELLVAGSGEPSLKVYQWREGHLLDQELFSGEVRKDLAKCLEPNDGERSVERLVVSNIWPVSYTVAGHAPRSHHPPHLLLVSFEGLPILLTYSLADDGHLKHHQTLTLGGNVLDVSIGPALWEVVVAIDSIHRPGSMKILNPAEVPKTEFFETFELFSDLSEQMDTSNRLPDESPEGDLRWEQTSLAMLLNSTASTLSRSELPSGTEAKDRKGITSPAGEILYGLENMRKKRGKAAAEAEQDEGAEDGFPLDAENIVPS